MGLLGILLGLALLVWLAFRGWSVLLLAPVAAIVAALFSGEPLLGHWTQTFMGSAGRFVAQFFPLFMLSALFGKLMDDSGSVSTIARFIVEKLGSERTVLAVVVAGALLTYGGVNMFGAFFVLAPMAQAMFRSAGVPRRLMPAAICLGTTTFTMSAMPGAPTIQNAIPMPFFGTTLFAAPGLGIIASAIMLSFGLWWLARAEGKARLAGEGYGAGLEPDVDEVADDVLVRERASTAKDFDPAEINNGQRAPTSPTPLVAAIPLVTVIVVNIIMTAIVLPRIDTSYLARPEFGSTSIAAVQGVWSVMVALIIASGVLVILNRRSLPSVRDTMDAGANASVLPVLSVASLVGFGAVVAALPAFARIQDLMMSIEGGPLVSLAVATNVLAGLTGSASGGLTIALDALGANFLRIAQETGMNPALLHRVAVIGSGTLDLLPHNGAVVTLLAVCGTKHGESYFDLFMVAVVGAIIGLIAVIGLGSVFGSF